jgi:hypothetical protein
MWYRVFGTNQTEPAPAALLEYLEGLHTGVAGKFSGDEQGWFRAELTPPATDISLELERYLVSEEGIRGEFNNWAAWIETQEGNPHQGPLMQHMISTTQLFTLRPVGNQVGPEGAEKLCKAICRFLARETAGVYQVDGQGFFAPDGTLLVKE